MTPRPDASRVVLSCSSNLAGRRKQQCAPINSRYSSSRSASPHAGLALTSYAADGEEVFCWTRPENQRSRQVELTGAQALVRSLEQQGVDVVFGLPGGAILPAYDPIRSSALRHVLVRHEQGAGHAAKGLSLIHISEPTRRS